jgi:uncharacterized membrane protein
VPPVIDIVLDLGIPALALFLAARYAWVRTVGAATLCYVGGMVYANLPLVSPDIPTAEVVGFGAVALSIPLLLFSVDVIAWTRLARTAVVAFVASCLVVGLVCLGTGWAFDGNLPWSRELAGMLAGVYTGGTPNMVALARAFETPPEVFVNCNASDLVLSAGYMLFMLTAAPRVLSRFFRPTPRLSADQGPEKWEADRPATIPQRALGIGLAAACSTGGGLVYAVLPSDFAMAMAILVITTLAVLASLVPAVRTLPGTYSSGLYLLLVFCFSAGSMADVGPLLSTSPGFLLFTFVTLGLIFVLQFAVMALLRIDRDTAAVTSVATIMSPPFIAPVADRFGNREVLFTGIASGLMGYAVGNYLGIAVTWLLGATT